MPAAVSISIVSAPWGLGSGKFVTPWCRMHFEKFNLPRSCVCCSCGLGGAGFGNSFWQACRAATNAGDFGLIPLDGVTRTNPCLSGSGKFGTPCARTQAEYATGPPWAPPEVDVEAVAVEVICATPGVE